MTHAALVAGVGNIFLGDDGFGVEVVRRLSQRTLKPNVRVVDFGIRGIDLAYTLLDGYEKVILVDAAPRGGSPGTLYVLEPDLSALGTASASLEAHGLALAQVLSVALAIGGRLDFVRIVGCEPGHVPDPDDIQVGLSPPVRAAIDEAVRLVEELVEGADA